MMPQNRAEWRCGTLHDRTLPSASTPENTGGGEINPLNLMFIVGFCILISVLARWLARRGRK